MKLARRDFLKASGAAGGALVLEFSFPAQALANLPAGSTEVNAWIVIHPDERVVIRIARSEMGQGSYTALAQLVAEELDCNWVHVSSEFASPNEHVRRKRIWGSMSTGGSQGIRSSQDYVRKAGASARQMLIAAAAARWAVPVAECSASLGVVVHGPTGQRLSYGQLAADAAKLTPPTEVSLRDPRDWKIAGRPLHRLDIPDKVLGRPVFGVDISMPGMLHAAIAQCPVFGGSLKAVDDSEALSMRGVKKVVRSSNFVAVVADSWWRADQAIKTLKIEWDEGEYAHASDASISAMLSEGLDAPNLPQARKLGDGAAGLAKAAKVVEAVYESPYLNHATLEPQTCTAWLRHDGFLEIWTSTQNGEASLATAAQVAGLPQEKVEVHKMMLGGGFGRRGASQDFVAQGVTIALALPGTPVKLMWSREQDMQHGYYRPASKVRIKAGVDAQSKLIALHTTVACPSILKTVMPQALGKDGIDGSAVRSFSDMPYDVPHQQVDYAQRNGHVPVGFWRGPGQQNAFYRECFIDELAAAAGIDPVDYRRSLLKPTDKNRLVLEEVVRASGWGQPLPAGVLRGVAVVDGFGSYSAMVVEVSVGAQKAIKLLRVVVAIDSGHVVNPDTCRAQAQSNVVYGLGPILYQANHIRNGHVVESNFHNFRLPQISDMPKVDVLLVPTGGFWGGHGEIGLLALAPAVCNAVRAATGQAVRRLPLDAA